MMHTVLAWQPLPTRDGWRATVRVEVDDACVVRDLYLDGRRLRTETPEVVVAEAVSAIEREVASR